MSVGNSPAWSLVPINSNQLLCDSVKPVVTSNSFHSVIITNKENLLIADFTLPFIENVIAIFV